MLGWLLIFGSFYTLLLAYNAYQGHSRNCENRSEFLYASGGIKVVPLFLSYSATLFSTFTIMGVPDFFRVHGVGTWIFIGVTDVAMAFVILWFGIRYRKVAAYEDVETMSELLRRRFGSAPAMLVYRIGIFVFLLPYVAIQIQGVSALLAALAPGALGPWAWSFAMLLIIWGYSAVGGLRAVVYSDVSQGLLLLGGIWIIAFACVHQFGGLQELMQAARAQEPALMTAPGPEGFMSLQYLFASFLVICLMPITQPQLTVRIRLARDIHMLRMLTIGIATFALLVLLPTIALGLYGAARYPGVPAAEFLAGMLVKDQLPWVGALAVLGIIAAAMSTADSQLFSLRSEFSKEVRDEATGPRRPGLRHAIIPFILLSFVLSLVSSAELVSLARVSFAGTALMAPMILLAVSSLDVSKSHTPLVAGLSMLLFALSAVGLFPASLGALRFDLALLLVVSAYALTELALQHSRETDVKP